MREHGLKTEGYMNEHILTQSNKKSSAFFVKGMVYLFDLFKFSLATLQCQNHIINLIGINGYPLWVFLVLGLCFDGNRATLINKNFNISSRGKGVFHVQSL